jgi:pantetheine-phosphate adenylyltransferase
LITALYPGTFDPITNGHIDIATRASKLFGKIIIGVYDNSSKHLLFTTEERVELASKSITNLPNVMVEPFSGLAVTFARKKQAQVMVRGLRMTSDFEREFELAMMNKNLDPELEMVAFMASLKYQFLSSSLRRVKNNCKLIGVKRREYTGNK